MCLILHFSMFRIVTNDNSRKNKNEVKNVYNKLITSSSDDTTISMYFWAAKMLTFLPSQAVQFSSNGTKGLSVLDFPFRKTTDIRTQICHR